MITGFITFFTIFAVVGAILYGRKLIKTEKTDAGTSEPDSGKKGQDKKEGEIEDADFEVVD